MGISAFENALARMDAEQLFVYTLVVFGAMILVGAVITYVIACKINQKTEISGFMRVSVSLNNPQSADKNEEVRLDYGEFLIGMQDVPGKVQYLFSPKRNWLEKASRRMYATSLFLQRFGQAFENAGGQEDAGCKLLKELLGSESFCADLGAIYRRNPKDGLRLYGTADHKKYGTRSDKLTVYKALPEMAAERFRQATNCSAKSISITMEYLAPNSFE